MFFTKDLSKHELDVGHGLAAHAAHGCHEPSEQDTEIRVEVQAQVAELVASITAELRELEEQRQDLANGKTTLQALSSQIAVIERRQTQSATCEPIRDEKLVDEVADLRAQVIKMQVALKDHLVLQRRRRHNDNHVPLSCGRLICCALCWLLLRIVHPGNYVVCSVGDFTPLLCLALVL